MDSSKAPGPSGSSNLSGHSWHCGDGGSQAEQVNSAVRELGRRFDWRDNGARLPRQRNSALRRRMSGLWMFILALGVIFCVMLLLAGAALFSPIIVTVDTAAHHVRIRWLLMLEYMVALPGGTGESRLSIAGNPVRIRPQKRTESSGAKAPDSRNQKKRGGRAAGAKFLIRCLRDS